MTRPVREALPLEVVGGQGAARALLDPLRRELLQGLKEPGSAATLARRLGLPRQRLNYHLRELEKAGLVSLVEERKRGNCTERLVRATATSYLISPEALGALGTTDEERRDRASASYLMAAAGRAIRTVGGLEARARAARKRLATLTLEVDVRFGSAAERAAFAEELATAVARLVSRHQGRGPGRTFRFLIAGYPAEPPRSEEP
jgi:DNA-binding transcriptional ArsR family regulator